MRRALVVRFWSMDVYVMKDGSRQGPFPPFRLTEMLEDGSLTPRDLVWHDGMAQWSPLGETPSLSAVLKTSAAPAVDTADDTDMPPPLPPRERQPSVEMALHIARERRRLAWRRFFARQIDLSLAAGLAIAGAMASGLATAWEMLSGFTGPVTIALGWVLAEALLLASWGTTPGRALLGIRVFFGEDQKLSLLTALKRSALVLAAGAALGLPIFPLLIAQWMYSFWQFQKYGTTLWDKTCGTRVAYRRLTGAHAGGIALFIAGLFSFTFWFNFYAPLPPTMSAEQRDIIEKTRKEFFDSLNQAKKPSKEKPAEKPAAEPVTPPAAEAPAAP